MNKKIIIGMGAVIVVLVAILLMLLLNEHEHSWSEWQNSKLPTCTKDGFNTRVCDECGESQSIAVYAQGHKYGNWTTTKEVTCTVNGSKERSCHCGNMQTETIKAMGHQYSEWATTKEATCTVNGTKERICDCGEKETETIVAAHSWTEATCIKAKTCDKCNITEGDSLGHTCAVGYCTRCKTDIKPIVHLPSAPLVLDCLTITELSYHFNDKGYLVITFAGYIHYYGISFDYKVVDADGYVVYTSLFWNIGYSAGDKFRDQTILLSSEIEGLSEFTIIIED